MYLGSVREAICQRTRDFRNRSISKAKGIDVYEAFRSATKISGEMARATRSRTIQVAEDTTTNKRVSTHKDSSGRQEAPSPQHGASFEDQLADPERKTSLPESEVNPSPPHRHDSNTSAMRNGGTPPRRDSGTPPRRDSDHSTRRDSDPPPRRDSVPPIIRDTEPPSLINTEPPPSRGTEPPLNPLLGLPPMIMPVPGPPIYPASNKAGKRSRKSQQQQPFPPPPIFLLPMLPPPMSLNKGATHQPDQPTSGQTQLSSPDPPRYPPQAYQQARFSRYNTGEMAVSRSQQSECPLKTDKTHAMSKCCVEKAIYRKLFDMLLSREKTQEYSNGYLKQCPFSGHVGMSLPKTKCGAKLDCRETQTSKCHYHQTCQTQTNGSLLTDCSRTKTFLQSCPTDQPQVVRCHNIKSVNVKRTETNPTKCFPSHQSGRVVNDCGTKSDRVNTSCMSCVNDSIEHKQDSSQEDFEHEKDQKPKTIQFTITRRKNKKGRPSSRPICLNLDVNQLYKFIDCQLDKNKECLDCSGNTAKRQNGWHSENGIEKATQCHSSVLERKFSVKSCQNKWISSKSYQTATECGCKETKLKSEKHDKIIQHTDCFASEINKSERNYILQSRDRYKPEIKCKPTPCYEILSKAECKDKNVKKSSGGKKKHKSDCSCRHEESSNEPCSSTTTTTTQHSDKFTRMLKKIKSLKEHIGFTKCNITNTMHLTKENDKQTLPLPNAKLKLNKTVRQECVPSPKEVECFCECKTRPTRRKRVKRKDNVTCENVIQTLLESGIQAAKHKTYEEPEPRTGCRREETFPIYSHSLTTGNTSGNSIYLQDNSLNIKPMESECDILSKLYSFSQTNKTVTSPANILMANVKMKKKIINHEDVRRNQHTTSLVHNTPGATKPCPKQSSQIHRNCPKSKTPNVEKLLKYVYTSKLDVDEIATTTTPLGESLIIRDSIKTQVDTEISLKSMDENESSNKSGWTGQSARDMESSVRWNGDSWTNGPSDTSKGVLDQAMDIHSWIPTMASRRSDQTKRSTDTCHIGTDYITSGLNVDHTKYTREDDLSANELYEGSLSYSLSDRLQTNNESSQRDYVSNTSAANLKGSLKSYSLSDHLITNNESSQRDYVSNTSAGNLSQDFYCSKAAIATPQNEREDETSYFKSGIRAFKNTSCRRTSYQIVSSPNQRRGVARDGDVISRSACQETFNDHVNLGEERIQVQNAMMIRNNVVEVLRNELGQKHDDDHTHASEDKVIPTETQEIPETLSTLTLSSECRTLENGGLMHSFESHQTNEVSEFVSTEGIKGDSYVSNNGARSSVVGLPPQSGNTLPSNEGQRLGHDLERRCLQPKENGDIVQKSKKGREEDWRHDIIYLSRYNTIHTSLSDITLYSLTLSETNNVLDVNTMSNFLPEEQSNESSPPIKNGQSQESMCTDPLTSFSELNPMSTQEESGFADNGHDGSQESCPGSYARAESVRENCPDSQGPKKCSPQKKCKRSDHKEKQSLNRKCEQKLDEQNAKFSAKVEKESCPGSYARAESVRENCPDSQGPKKCSPQKKCERSDHKEKQSLNRKCEQKLDEQNAKFSAKVEKKCKKQTDSSITNGRQDRDGEERKKACKQKKDVSSAAKNVVCRENTPKDSKTVRSNNESKEIVPNKCVDKKMSDLTEPSKPSIPRKVKQKYHKKRVCDSTFCPPECVEGVNNDTSVMQSDSSIFDVPSCRCSDIDLHSESPRRRCKGVNNKTIICMACRKRKYDVWGKCICECVINCPESFNERENAMCLRMMAQKERLTKLVSKIDHSILCPFIDHPKGCDESTGNSKSNRPTDFQTFNVKTSKLMRCWQKSHRDKFQCCLNKRQRYILERTREERNSYKKLCSYFQSLLQDIFPYKTHRLSMRPPKPVTRAGEVCGSVTRPIGHHEDSSSSSSFSCVCLSSGELFAI